MTSRSVLVVDDFAPEAESLRAHYDARFADPRSARGDRFVWDYWHVPGQYTALRTPAWQYFPKRAYEAFHRRLVQWGRHTLGCHDVSPPWLSCYVEGCGQELHGDLPHGPWAFVFSLTRWRGRAFRGGETLIVRDEVLDFWADFVSVRSVEEGDLLRAVEPRFGRLVAFDPRLPHGVRRVSGTHDPREGRLVVHGWFVQPRPFVEGPLGAAELGERVAELGEAMGPWLGGGLPLAGLLSLGVRVGASGEALAAKVLSDTTRVPAAFEVERRRFVGRVRRAVGAWRFSKQRAPSHITLPLVFERDG
ncbi:MAG TPA: 2OG-Fe(II) oxygenase [Polyangiaceae bacterium]|nr:2OG-Fe(II) oxygenase [Polyangiaceae bacterium]